MNKTLVVAVVVGGLALGGVFFVAGIFTGISVSLKEEPVPVSSEHWPPKSSKSPASAPEGAPHAPAGGVLQSQVQQAEDKARIRAENVPQRGIEKLFEKVPQTAETTPFANALKGAAQTSVARAESASLDPAKKSDKDSAEGKEDPAPKKEASEASAKPDSAVKPDAPAKPDSAAKKEAPPSTQQETPKNLQLEEASPILVTKPDKLIPTTEELFEELSGEEEETPAPAPKEAAPMFLFIGTLSYEEMSRVSTLLRGHGYKLFKRKVPSRETQRFQVFSGPFRNPRNAQPLLRWMKENGFKNAVLLSLDALKKKR
ncbi:MAG: hypothetical protein LBJ70_05020 [Holosporales bacterium]|jgi:hypothetical protein|nr:hypothetical protein [Holosporales bacterium]